MFLLRCRSVVGVKTVEQSHPNRISLTGSFSRSRCFYSSFLIDLRPVSFALVKQFYLRNRSEQLLLFLYSTTTSDDNSNYMNE